jgi:hypothetical protein
VVVLAAAAVGGVYVFGQSEETNVYVAGWDMSLGAKRAFAGEELTGMRMTAPVDGSEAKSVFVPSDGDMFNMYWVGSYKNEQGEMVAFLAKPGDDSLQELSNPDFGCEAQSVYVSGGDVYVAGVFSYLPMLWKNGEIVILDGLSKKGGKAFSVFVSDNDVYVAGFKNNEQDIVVATLWKNGQAQRLSDGRRNAYAFSVFVSGRDVYVAGFEENTQGNTVATLWKNGQAQRLSDERRNAYALSVFVSGRDVYVAGRENNAQGKGVATLWKNGRAQRLSDGGSTAVANSVFVSGRDVYVAGGEDSLYGTRTRLWKNGKVQNSTDEPGYLNSVFVVKKKKGKE